jgi:predicted RNA methylase
MRGRGGRALPSAGLKQGHWSWSLELHRKLLSDTTRNEAFRAALKRVIVHNSTTRCLNFIPTHLNFPESIVADIGSGTGFLSFLAARLGAKKCYLYEADHDVRASPAQPFALFL